jgi:phage tail sheath gpL-like
MDQVILAGIIPIQSRNGVISIVRAISTYTKNTAGAVDITWQELTTQRISDFIMKDMRARLASKYSRSKNTIAVRNSIKSDVTSALLDYQVNEYIENVDTKLDASINVNANDPTRSDVKFKYDVVSPLNVIKLTGHLVI